MRSRKFALISISAAALAILAAPAFRAQEIESVTRIVPVPEGVYFAVDGVFYNRAVSMIWPKGSKHTLFVDIAPQGDGKTIHEFDLWQSNDVQLPGGRAITITADPVIQEIRAIFSTKYALGIIFFDCGGVPPAQCNSSGTVDVGSTRITSDTLLYFGAGSTVRMTATPNPGFVFQGWAPGPSQTIAGPTNTVTLNRPMSVYPRFVYGKRIKFETDPPGLLILADHSPVATPTVLDWATSSTHTLSGYSPQQDLNGKWWTFQSWSDGGESQHTYTVTNPTAAETIIAKYIQLAVTQVLTSPPRLKVQVDGRDNWPSLIFPWGAGEKHKLEAPVEQIDEQGRAWRFQSWSNGGAASQDLVVPEFEPGMSRRLTATYEQMAHLTINSSIGGLRVKADDTECATPCDIRREVNTRVRLTAPASIPMGDDTRVDFEGWPGSGSRAAEWSITLGADPVTLTAEYRIMNRLSISSDPPTAVSWQLQPPSPDGFYDAQTDVTITVTPLAGFRFRSWSGDLSGSTPSGVVSMNSPRAVRGKLDAVPHVDPAGVINAAGATPNPAVAPGSIVSVFGVNLANTLEIGPDVPMAQTLGGLSVRLGDRLLPLLFASPTQVNLQLPPDVSEGTQTLVINVVGAEDIKVSFPVVRAAPGIFTQAVNGELFAVAVHEDGSPVTIESPARRGELVTVYGTGFGPTDRPRLVGFPIPAEPPFLVLDTVGILLGETPVMGEGAVAAPGRTGVDMVQFRIGGDLPAGNASLRLTINGQESNTVLLPVQ